MRKQCSKCPWRVDVDPYEIPGGYSEGKHRALVSTVSSGTASLRGFAMMACHGSDPGQEFPCVGWMANQLGPGNNLGLSMAVLSGAVDGEFELVGDQHETLEATFPEETSD